MRVTCAATSVGADSFPICAACNSVSSGMVCQSVDASREATCHPVSGARPSAPTTGFVGPISQW